MDLKIAWWNCHISAPSTQVTPGKVTLEFAALIMDLLEGGVDILCLGEVNKDNCDELQAWIGAASTKSEYFLNYQVLSLYSKDGNKIDDYGVIYRQDKFSLVGDPVDLNAAADVTNKHLKVGKKICFRFEDGCDLWVILCHWQSLTRYSEDSHVRTEVATTLRDYIKDIYTDNRDALIVICGDFNDEPFSRSIQMALKASRDISYVRSRSDALFNPFWRLMGMTDLVSGTHLPAGTCASPDAQYLTNRRTFDQIILSSRFLQEDWCFVGSGVEIISSLNSQMLGLDFAEVSDHYPVSCSLRRLI